jgi:hypothetical protein
MGYVSGERDTRAAYRKLMGRLFEGKHFEGLEGTGKGI